MTLTLFYPATPPNFPRSYCKGFITSTFITTIFLSGTNVVMTKPAFNLVYNLAITPRFYAPTSNIYSLDFVFDPAGSYATILGIPIDTGLFIATVFDPVDFSYRIHCEASSPPSHSLIADLPAVPGYWTPI
jgi:hypothetical protein